MAQADQNVQNAGFPTVRADINDNLAALFSQSSGSSAPSVTVAGQPWIDTSVSPPLWKVRNASNNAWITIGTLDPAGFNISGVTAIANGGTGQTTATAALTALLPNQSGNSGKALTTNGTVASWGAVNANSDKQVFTANGTWTKPSFGTVALITVWGGGGGGAKGITNIRRAGGGGGGACSQRLVELSDLPSTVAVTVGAGGTGSTAAGGGNGSAGGDTWFGASLTNAYAAAQGGSAGQAASNSSSNANGGGGGDVYVGNGGGTTTISSFGSGANDGNDSAGFGGAGGGGYDNSINDVYSGGEAFYGGAGGGAVNTFGAFLQTSVRGYSVNGGNGGDGSTGTGNAGSSRGGGGGGGITSGGNGGGGLCIVYVW